MGHKWPVWSARVCKEKFEYSEAVSGCWVPLAYDTSPRPVIRAQLAGGDFEGLSLNFCP